MPDVFISYSRKDKDFVRQLHDRLNQIERDTWVDWEDIPVTAEWWQEIQRGIEAADSFLFIISPDSIASEVCNREIEHAIEHHKRLIPVLRRDALQQNVHDALARHNWLFMREHDDFDSGFEQLIKALDTDLDYVRAHTRLLVRAREWDDKARGGSFVLRGEDLSAAETWLALSAGKEPQPTDLHRQYILASRRAASARQRATLAGVSIALAITGVLTVISFVLFGLAETSRQESDLRGTEVAQQAATATNALGLSQIRGTEVAQQAATAIAAESTAVRRAEEAQSLGWAFASRQVAGSGDADLSLLLALQANQLPNPPAVARAQLVQAAYAPGTRRVYAHDSGERMTGMDISPNGERLLTGAANADLLLWDAETGALLRRHSFGDERIESGGFIVYIDAVGGLKFIDNTRALVLVAGDAVIWDVENWVEVSRLPVSGRIGTALDITENGALALVGYSDGRLRLWELDTGNLVTVLPGHDFEEQVTSVHFSADGRRALSSSWGADARLWDAKEGRLLMTYAPVFGDEVDDPDSFGAVLSPDESEVWLGMDTSTIFIYDTETGEGLRQIDLQHPIQAIAFARDGERVIVTTGDFNVLVLDADSGAVERRFIGHTAFVSYVALSADNRMLYTASEDGTARAWWLDGGAQIARTRPLPDGSPQIMARLADGRLLVGGSTDDPALLLLEPDGMTVIRRMEGHTDAIGAAAALSDGRTALTGSFDGTVRRWNLETGELLQTYPFATMYVLAVIPMDADRSFMTVLVQPQRLVSESYLRVWSLETGALLREYEHTLNGIISTGVIFDEGRRMALGGTRIDLTPADDYVAILNLETGEIERTFPNVHRGGVLDIAISPDETLLVSAGDDGQLVVWDIASGAERRRFIGHSDAVRHVRFSPDGRLVVSASFDGTVRVWERGSWQELIRLSGHQDRVRDAIFSIDSARVFSGDVSGDLIVWHAATDSETVRAWLPDYRYLRAFTCPEQAQYIILPLCP